MECRPFQNNVYDWILFTSRSSVWHCQVFICLRTNIFNAIQSQHFPEVVELKMKAECKDRPKQEREYYMGRKWGRGQWHPSLSPQPNFGITAGIRPELDGL